MHQNLSLTRDYKESTANNKLREWTTFNKIRKKGITIPGNKNGNSEIHWICRAHLLLIHSCLSHIPSYLLPLFKIPAAVVGKIEKLQMDFLWLGAIETKRDHLTRWDLVCKPKVKGGLGFGKIPLSNHALLGKWLWRFLRESSALWHQVILSIHGTHTNRWDANTIVK